MTNADRETKLLAWLHWKKLEANVEDVELVAAIEHVLEERDELIAKLDTNWYAKRLADEREINDQFLVTVNRLEARLGAALAQVKELRQELKRAEIWLMERHPDHQQEGLAIIQAALSATGQNYPCDKCGKPRTKAQGGAVFTVCDACWDEAKR